MEIIVKCDVILDFIEIVKKRRSIRKYKSDQIPEKQLKYVIEAARLAPSWANKQPWKFIIVTDQVLKRKITMRDWAAEAPIVIVGIANPTLSGTRADKHYYLLDMGIAMEHMMLAAAELGLGTCWIGGQFNEDIVRDTLKIPDQYRVVALTPLGYSDEKPSLKERKDVKEIIINETWQ